MFKSSMIKIGFAFIVGLGIASLSSILNHNDYGMEYAPFHSLWPGLLGFVVATYYLIDAQAYFHSERTKKELKINHLGANILRGAVAGVVISILHAFYWHWASILTMLIFSAGYIGLVFNIRYNSYMGHAWDYISPTDDKPNSDTDKIFNDSKWGGRILMGIEVIVLGITTYLYLV